MAEAITFDNLIARPSSEKIFLAEVKPGEHILGWDFYPGSWDLIDWDLIDEDCADISDWVDEDTDTGVSEVDPAGQFRFDTNAGAAGNAGAGRSQVVDVPATFTVEIKLYHDEIGTFADLDYFYLQMRGAAGNALSARFASDGLFITKAAGATTEVGTNLVKESGAAEWQTWRFVVDLTAELADVYLTDSTHTNEKVGTGVDCDYVAGDTDTVHIAQYGHGTDNMVTHIDHVKLSSTGGLVYSVSYLNETITFADGTTTTLRKEIASLEEDGTALTKRPNISTLSANPGSFYHDLVNGILYVHMSGSDDPIGYTLIGLFWVYLSTHGVILGPLDLVDEECSDISEWTDYDYDTGVSEVSPAGQFRFDTNLGAAGNAYSGRGRWIDIPTSFVAEIKLYHDDIGTIAGDDWFLFNIRGAAGNALSARFASDGLFIMKAAAASTEVGTNLVKEGASAEWQTWRFVVDLTLAVVDVYLTDSTYTNEKVGSAIDCDYTGGTNDMVYMIQYGYTTDDMVTHMDYVKVSSGDRYYEPYISSNGIPALTQKNPSIYWGVSQISAGNLVLLNDTGYFDQIYRKFIWDWKKVRLLLGGENLPYSEYNRVFTGKISDKDFTKRQIVLKLKSNSFDLFRSIPINNFWTSNYPNLDPAAEGKPIPYYYGEYSSVHAPIVTCIDTAWDVDEYQFKICDHASLSITQVYIDYADGAGWQNKAHGDEDLANSTFTIEDAAFVLGTTKVKVAFQGIYSGAAVLEKGSEIIKDLLQTYCNYTDSNLELSSFVDSLAASDFELNVPIEKVTSVMTIIDTICKSEVALFDEDTDGLLRYRVRGSVIDPSAPSLDYTDFLDSAIPIFNDVTKSLFWKIRVGYSYNCANKEYLYKEESDNISKYKYEKSEVLTNNTYVRGSADAIVLAQRLLLWLGIPLVELRGSLKVSQITKNLGDQFKVTLIRAPSETVGGISDGYYEMFEMSKSFFPTRMKVGLLDLANFGIDVGYWMNDAAPNWGAASDAEKAVSGFWCNADGEPTGGAGLISRWW